MDKYTKFLLTVIAVAMVEILFKDISIMDANAAMNVQDYQMFRDSLQDIFYAIKGSSLSCN